MWRVEIDNPKYDYVLIKEGMWWWAKYYICKRPSRYIVGFDTRSYFPYLKESPPLKNKRVALAYMKLIG